MADTGNNIAKALRLMYAPPKRAMAATGVKFGQWGRRRINAAPSIANTIIIVRAFRFLLSMFYIFCFGKIIKALD
jgi:hypothetical protein